MQLYAQQFYNETPEAKHWVDSVFKSLTKKQRIAQLMVIRESAPGPVIYDSAITAYIKQYNIGSLCLFQGGPVEQANYLNKYQNISKTPLMICIDGETGLGMRMTDSVMKFPDQLTLGAMQDAAIVNKIGKAIGAQCKREGIQVDYAPVVDINNNPDNPVINYRSYGENKYKVALFGTQMMKGIQSANVMATAKHFPGHGDVAVDSHKDLPVINKSLEQLDSLELYPFKALFKEGVGSVMIAHLSIPAIDTTAHLPTSLSTKNVTDLLRNKLGFNGISFTDALEMQGVAKYYQKGDASLQSLIAGNDMLCLPGDIQGSIDKIQHAMKKKILRKKDIYARVKKVLLVKYNMGLNNLQTISTSNLTSDLNKDVPALRREVAENAFTLLRLKDDNLLPVTNAKKIAYVGIGLTSSNTLCKLLQQQYHATVFLLGYKDDTLKAKHIFDSLQVNYDEVIIGVHQLNKYPANQFGFSDAALKLIRSVQQTKQSITLLFGNPYASKYISNANNLLICYEDDAIFQQAAFDWLNGKFNAKGKLPVTVNADFKEGDGLVYDATMLPVVQPESAGFDGNILTKIDTIANMAIAQHATPGCVVLVAKEGKVAFYKSYGYMTYDSTEPVVKDAVYDLASVTKTSATTVAVMKLYEEGRLDIHKTLGDYLYWLKGTDKADLTLENVLLHQAGLNPFIPFYKETIDTLTGIPKPGFYQTTQDSLYNIRVAENMYLRKDWNDTMYKRIAESKLSETNKYVYSDNDFILMGKIVEAITGQTLDKYVRDSFYIPMGMVSTSFKPREHDPLNLIAPTEKEKIFRLQQMRGDVHDPGAAMFGGVAGHAGLFSNAYDLAKLYQMLLNGGTIGGRRYLQKQTIDYFTAYHSNVSRRGLGFDKPEKDNATSKEPYPCKAASPSTYGHTGFTGICVWVDPAYHLVYVFLSNRVNPDGGDNTRLSKLSIRSSIQDAIYSAMLQKQ
jgi:beta-glucosidase-like glycosyl hydrolase/CubicO group peptidase (beta-lactamase class C family)